MVISNIKETKYEITPDQRKKIFKRRKQYVWQWYEYMSPATFGNIFYELLGTTCRASVEGIHLLSVDSTHKGHQYDFHDNIARYGHLLVAPFTNMV